MESIDYYPEYNRGDRPPLAKAVWELGLGFGEPVEVLIDSIYLPVVGPDAGLLFVPQDNWIAVYGWIEGESDFWDDYQVFLDSGRLDTVPDDDRAEVVSLSRPQGISQTLMGYVPLTSVDGENVRRLGWVLDEAWRALGSFMEDEWAKALDQGGQPLLLEAVQDRVLEHYAQIVGDAAPVFLAPVGAAEANPAWLAVALIRFSRIELGAIIEAWLEFHQLIDIYGRRGADPRFTEELNEIYQEALLGNVADPERWGAVEEGLYLIDLVEWTYLNRLYESMLRDVTPTPRSPVSGWALYLYLAHAITEWLSASFSSDGGRIQRAWDLLQRRIGQKLAYLLPPAGDSVSGGLATRR